ncbi:MAG: rod shape determining protein RodA [Patescibacteria group bacterium]|jgi:rod shape determining protein RodA|nr:rod shape determining protein RodA [Patescibacteria group bacterium]
MSELIGRKPFTAWLSEWPLLLIPVALTVLGILTMHTFGDGNSLAPRQIIWLGAGVVVFLACATFDMRFIRRTPVILVGYGISIALLLLLLVATHAVQGAKSWFDLGFFSLQPADPIKLIFIALMAKYFSRRHMEIGDFRHIIVSGGYAAGLILLILVEPDLGTAVIFSIVWFGMILVSGISKKHLAIIVTVAAVAAAGLWVFALRDYQRDRIVSFLNPAADIHGTGYNAYQATVAVGSGEIMGKGIGYGTQSKLRFLPEYETDFIFAAYAEEWGFVGVSLVLVLYGLLLARLLAIARRSETNFDALFTIGVALLFLSHIFIHTGINLGLLPVTGTTIPFMSYGGSHLIVEFAALGIVASLARNARSVPREQALNEYLGG